MHQLCPAALQLLDAAAAPLPASLGVCLERRCWRRSTAGRWCGRRRPIPRRIWEIRPSAAPAGQIHCGRGSLRRCASTRLPLAGRVAAGASPDCLEVTACTAAGEIVALRHPHPPLGRAVPESIGPQSARNFAVCAARLAGSGDGGFTGGGRTLYARRCAARINPDHPGTAQDPGSLRSQPPGNLSPTDRHGPGWAAICSARMPWTGSTSARKCRAVRSFSARCANRPVRTSRPLRDRR